MDIDIAFTELNGFVRKLTCRLDSLLKNQILKPEAYPIDGLSTCSGETPYSSAHAYSSVNMVVPHLWLDVKYFHHEA